MRVERVHALRDRLGQPRLRRLQRDAYGTLDRFGARASVRDDRDAVHAEHRYAAVLFIVEPRAHAIERRPGEQPAHLRDGGGHELLADRAEQHLDDALAELEYDITHEAIAHDHIDGAGVDIAPLDVADEVEVERGGRRLDELMRLLD